MTPRAIRMKYRPSVATVLIVVNMVILLLPLAGIVFFRIYENQLVRETETELIAQAAVIGAAYKQALQRQLPGYARYGRPVSAPGPEVVEGRYAPVLPQIRLPEHPILPRRPRARDSEAQPAAPVMAAGREITRLFVDAQRTTLSGMRLLDPEGIVIGGQGEVGQSLAHVAEVADAMRGRHRSVVRERISDQPAPPVTSLSRGTGIRIFVAYPVIDADRLRGVVYMSRTPNSILHHMYFSRHRLLAVGALIVVLALLIAWITSRTLLRPIRQLSSQARELAEGTRRSIEPLEHYGTRELAGLGQSFADMATALERRSEYVRTFATHVSHEFRTPLTAIRGAAELLAEHHDDMDETERRRFLANIDGDAQRLKVLVERLLDLARADSRPPPPATLDLREAVRGLEARHAIIRADVEATESPAVRMSAETFQMIAGNLIANAEQAGATRVHVSVRPLASGVEVLFEDDGNGISPGNRAKIFDPFFTTRRDTGGTGLGLGIVRSLVEAHGGTVELREATSGASFALVFHE